MHTNKQKHVLYAKASGVPVTVHRPSLITGHSKTGYSNITDYVNRYLVGCVQVNNKPCVGVCALPPSMPSFG